MTLAVSTGANSYALAGDLAPLGFTSALYAIADLSIEIRDSVTNALIKVAVYPTDYTVLLATAPSIGATVTPIGASLWALGRTAWLIRKTSLAQPDKLEELQKFPGRVIEAGEDRIVAMMQDSAREMARTARALPGEAGPAIDSLATRKGLVAVFDATTGDLVGKSIASLNIDAALVAPSWLAALFAALGAGWAAVFANPLTSLISTFMQSALVVTSAHAFAKAVDGSLTLQTYAALSALTGKAANVTYKVLGGDAAGDGAHGEFYYDPASSATAVAGIVLANDVGGAGRSIRLFSGYVHLKWSTRGGLANDCRAQVQAALDYCYANKHVLFVPAGGTTYTVSQNGVNPYCLLNEGVSIIFEEAPTAFGSKLAPFAGLASSVSIMRLRPRVGSTDFLLFRWMEIDPGANGGAPLGKHALHGLFDLAIGMQNVVLDHCRFDPGNDYSLNFFSDDAVNAQGVPFSLKILGGYYAEGIKVAGVSDTFHVDNGVMIRSTTGGNRIGISYQGVTAAGGRPQKALIQNANIDCDGGGIAILSGGAVELRSLDIEQSRGTVTAVIDISGSDESADGAIIDGVAVGVFGAAAVTNVIRLNVCNFPKVENYKLIAAPTAGGYTAPSVGILITASCNDAFIGNGEISSDAGRITTPISDLGAGSRGFPKSIAPTAPYGNIGGGFGGLTVQKNLDGTVRLFGRISGTSVASPQTICTLPVGFRPDVAWNRNARGSKGGGVGDVSYQLLNTGVFSAIGATGVDDLSIDFSFPTLPYIVAHL